MIKLTKFKSNDEFVLNAELIETVESTPDTVITLTTGKKLLVEETMDEVVHQVLDYRRAISRSFR